MTNQYSVDARDMWSDQDLADLVTASLSYAEQIMPVEAE
jgi:hypothetical protein